MKKKLFFWLSVCILVTGCAKNVLPSDHIVAGAEVTHKAVPGVIIAKHIVNNAVDKNLGNQKGFEYIIKLHDGTTISLTLRESEKTQFTVNQHVLVLYGATVRIAPDDI